MKVISGNLEFGRGPIAFRKANGLCRSLSTLPTTDTSASAVNFLAAKRQPAADERGNALVEMALVLPVLLLVVTCIFSFGIAINNYLELTDATAIGSRLLAISRQQTMDPCHDATQAIYNAAPYLKQSSMTFTYVFNGVSYPGTSCSSGSYTTGAAGNMTAGSTAQVIVTYPCAIAVYGHNYAPNCTLAAQTTELVQ